MNPYLVFESIVDMERDATLPEGLDAQTAEGKFIKAINKGLLKIFSKMGISTVQSYCGAQIFEAIGLNHELIDRYFTGTASRVEGSASARSVKKRLRRHRVAYEPTPIRQLDFGGEIHYRIQGEHHNWNPDTIYKLQHATMANDPKSFAEFSQLVNDESKRRSNLRGLLEFKFLPEAIPLDEVESAKEIVKRFTTGAMSFGAISKEAHETLAIAMNRIGAKSNTGEGGEDPERFVPLPNGDSKNSYIKQVASARFGVTSHYLVNAKELQIKMAQGAKPGEGGQLPGHKVDESDREVALCHAGRAAHFSATAPRYLFHRGSGPAHFRSEELQPRCGRLCQAGSRSGSGHGRGRCCEGACGQSSDQRRFRRHRRLAPGLDQIRRGPVGVGFGRNASNVGAERSARTNSRRNRRAAEDRPRRRRSPRCWAPKNSASRPRR